MLNFGYKNSCQLTSFAIIVVMYCKQGIQAEWNPSDTAPITPSLFKTAAF